MPEILVDFPSMRDYFVFVVVGRWQDSPFCSLLERRSGKTIRKVLFAFARTAEALWDGLCPEGFFVLVSLEGVPSGLFGNEGGGWPIRTMGRLDVGTQWFLFA